MATVPTSRNDHDPPEAASSNDEPELRFRAVFENTLDAMLLVDDEGRIVDANAAAEVLFGVERAELLTRRSFELMHEASSDDATRLSSTFCERGSQRGEMRVRRADGRIREVEYVATTQVLPGRHLSVLRDLTERLRDEASLRFLAEASRALAASLDYETTLRSVARMAVPAVADWAVIDVARSDGSLQRMAVAHVDEREAHVARIVERLPLGADDPAGPGKVIRTGEPDVRYDVSEPEIDAAVPDREMRAVLGSIGLRSLLCVPLRTRGRVIGALSLAFTDSDRRYEPSDLALAEELARRIAIALENAQLYGAAEAARAAADASAKRAELLSEASRVLATMRDCDAMLRTAARTVVPQLCDWCFADRVDEDGALRRAAVVHARPEDAELAAALELGSGRPLAQLGEIGVPILETPQVLTHVDDALLRALARDSEHLEALRALAPRTVIILPLVARGRILGSLALVRSRDPRPFSPDEIALSEELARRVAVAVDNVQLQRATEIAEQRARFLADAGVALASSLDDEGTLPNVTRLTVPRLADMAAAYVLGTDGSIRPVAVSHVDPELEPLFWELHAIAPAQIDQDDYPLSTVVRTGRSLLLPEVTPGLRKRWASSARAGEILEKIAMTSSIVVPIAQRGRVLGALTMSASVSGRRFGAADLAVAEELARRVATALENAQLYRDAREASRLKDEFLATISHELRTPLNAILGWATILPTRLDSPEAIQRGLAVIERNARAQARVIDDVLDVSRIVSGKLRLHKERVDLATVIRAAVESVGPSASVASIEVSTNLAPDLGELVVDADRLRQIVWNILSNAVKFTPPQGHVRVFAKRSPEDVVIEIEDDGVGIDPEFLPYLFDRFRQADSSMTRRHGGLGLGLAIARDLTELHGGSIHVESASLEKGTRFRIVLPVRATPNGADVAETAALEGVVESAPPLDGVRVLVCDDDADSRELMADLLQGAGAHVETSASASEALASIAKHPPDVLISDIAMPGEDGYALIRRVRARPPESGGNVPAVALTAYAGAAERRRALEAGFHQHVAKPVDPADLLVVVANLAGRFAPV